MKIKTNKSRQETPKQNQQRAHEVNMEVYIVLANYAWAWGLPWDEVDIRRGTPLEKTGSWNFNFIYEYVCAYRHISVWVPQGIRRRCQIFRSWGYKWLCVPQHGCWGWNLGPPEKEREWLRSLGVCFLTLHFYFYKRSCFVILAHVIIVS